MSRYASPIWFVAMGLVALLLAPVVVLAGDPALARHRRSVHTARILGERQGRAGAGPAVGTGYRLDLALFRFGMHPLVIALTAPARWVRGRLRRLLRSPSARRRGWDGRYERLFPDDPGLSGVREPRRPHPTPPTDAVSLRQPTEHTMHD